MEDAFSRMPESQSSKRERYTWSLDDKQIAVFGEWRNEIWRTDKRSPGAIGGTFTFQITGTTIGTIIKAVYRGGEKELDLTDYCF